MQCQGWLRAILARRAEKFGRKMHMSQADQLGQLIPVGTSILGHVEPVGSLSLVVCALYMALAMFLPVGSHCLWAVYGGPSHSTRDPSTIRALVFMGPQAHERSRCIHNT